MNIAHLTYRCFSLLLILLSFSPVISTYLTFGKLAVIYSYVVYLVMAFICLFYFCKNKKMLFRKYRIPSILYILMILYILAAIIKLIFVPSGIFPFQRMQVMCSFLCFGGMFIMLSDKNLANLNKNWWKWMPLFFLIVFILIHRWHYMSILCFCLFYLIVSDCLKRNKRLFVYFAIIMMIWGIFQRMEYIRIAGAVVIFLCLRYNLIPNKYVCGKIFQVLLVLPLLLLLLGIMGMFNVFDMDSYVETEYISASGERMNDDTRTLLYEESIASAIKNNYVIYGRTPAYGYDTPWFTIEGTNHAWNDVRGLFPQRNSEVFVINIFTWMGIIGFLTWLIFFYYTGYKAIKQSNNKYIRAFALFIGVYWIGCWIENPFDHPSPHFFILYIVSSLCLRSDICQFNDIEMKSYLKNIL